MLNAMFLPRDVGLILKIPVNDQYEDMWCWREDIRGTYAVKHGYRLLSGLYADHQPSNVSWRCIWKMKIPPKVHNFLWRCMHNVIPTVVALSSRRVEIDTLCPLCRQYPENLVHLLCSCEKVLPLWQDLGGVVLPQNNEGFADWLMKRLSDGEATDNVYIAAICWSIWSGRNEYIWNGKPWRCANIKMEVQRLVCEWTTLHAGLPHASQTIQVSNLTGSGADEIKVFVDAAVFMDDVMDCFGCAIFDGNGTFIGAKNGYIRALKDIHLAEALAVKEALSWVKEIGITKLVIFSDCQVVCHFLNNSESDRSCAGCAINACKELQRHFEVVSYRFITRSENKCAHVLARAAHSPSGPSCWFSIIPSCIAHLI